MSSTAPNKPLIALVDCNNFYASCERVFNPKLLNKPVVILSNNDGCVIARSNEAKALGIPMGAPAFQYQALFKKHQVFVCSSNYILYGDMSSRVMRTLASFTSDLQIYSIDEAFLLLDQPQDAKIIRETVLQWTGIPVSIGLAPTKTLAKAANYFVKKNPQWGGVFVIDTPKQQEMLSILPVEEVWGIGRRLSAFLHTHQIKTAWDLCNANDQWIRKNLSVVGLKTVWELRGISCLPLEEAITPKKSITCSRSFGERLTEKVDIAEALSSYTARAAEKLRGEESLASFLQVFLLTSYHQQNQEYYENSVQIIFPQPTDYTPSLIHFAKEGLHKIFKKGLLYKKVGVILGGLVSAASFQMDLFVNQETDQKKQRILMNLIDQTNQKFGRNTLKLAAEGIKQPWKMKKEQQSHCFTTRWDEILTIHL